MGETGGRVLVAISAVLVLLAVSLWITVPLVLSRIERDRGRGVARGDSKRVEADVEALRQAASVLRQRARGRADLENRIAFLYGVPPSTWPPALAPESRMLVDEDPERVAGGMPAFLHALENGRAILAKREAEDPRLVREVPAILPLGDAVFEPSAYFGPRRSPWTNEEEFLTGVEIAAPAGATVVAPGEGVVCFAGTVRQGMGGHLWQLGNVVILSHGSRGATVFGHLGRIDVRRGQRVSRGARIGAVGASGWAVSPQLHYEYWRSDGTALRPTNPLFAVLDLELETKPYSLERMDASWAPGQFSGLPGIGIQADEAAAPHAPESRRRTRRRL